MAVMLPGEVAHLLQLLGFEWPEGNEDRVFDFAGRWMQVAPQLDRDLDGGRQAAQHVLANSEGPGVDAFRQRFERHEGPQAVGHDLGTAANLTGGVLILIAGAIVALKVVVVIQLVQLAITIAEAIAAAVPTLGASTTLIPLAELAAQYAIRFAINAGLEILMG